MYLAEDNRDEKRHVNRINFQVARSHLRRTRALASRLIDLRNRTFIITLFIVPVDLC